MDMHPEHAVAKVPERQGCDEAKLVPAQTCQRPAITQKAELSLT